MNWTDRYPQELDRVNDHILLQPFDCHDFRDVNGKPDRKRESGAWSDWPNRPDMDMNLRGRR